MSDIGQGEVPLQTSLSAKRWDYVCVGVLLAPLVLMAFQGDLLFGVAERINYRGGYTEIRQREVQLLAAKKDLTGLDAQKAAIDPQSPLASNQYKQLQVRQLQRGVLT